MAPNSVGLTKVHLYYLGLHLDNKLHWRGIQNKKQEIVIKTNEINWLIGRKSKLSLENRIPIYKAVIKPIWTYSIQLWGCASKSHSHPEAAVKNTPANSERSVVHH
jgi:hypothetical protein